MINWITLSEVRLILITSHLSEIVHSLIFLCRKSREVRGKIKDGHGRRSCRFHWLLVKVTLVVAFGFLPQNLGGSGDLRIVILLERNAASVVPTMSWSNTNKLSYMYSQVVGTQELSNFP